MKLCSRHLSPHLLGPVKSVCAGAKVWRNGEVWRGARGRARDEGWEKDKGKDREAELWQKQGQRWAEAKRELKSGARMAPPHSRD